MGKFKKKIDSINKKLTEIEKILWTKKKLYLTKEKPSMPSNDYFIDTNFTN